MTAIEMVLQGGEYRRYQELVSEIREGMFDPHSSFKACKRFLVRVLSRAVLDVCMYPEDNPHHLSAKRWFFGRDEEGEYEFPIEYGDLVDMVELDWMSEQVEEMANAEGVHREEIRRMKSLLYNLNNGSAGQPS